MKLLRLCLYSSADVGGYRSHETLKSERAIQDGTSLHFLSYWRIVRRDHRRFHDDSGRNARENELLELMRVILKRFLKLVTMYLRSLLEAKMPETKMRASAQKESDLQAVIVVQESCCQSTRPGAKIR